MKTGSLFKSLESEAFRQLGGVLSVATLLLSWLAASPAQGSGTNYTLLSSFSSITGANPFTDLTLAPNGTFYGTTHGGGSHNLGTVFTLVNSNPVTLFSFDGTNHGANPWGALTAVGTALYGTTYGGGAYGAGTVFVVSNGTLTTLASFGSTNANGSGPRGALFYNTNDFNLYGTTYGGGDNGFGTVFRLDTNGTLTTLASFDRANSGAWPCGGVVLGSDGNLYGTTSSGGTNTSGLVVNNGTVFMYQLQAGYGPPLSLVYSFTGTNDGKGPQAGLVLGPDGQTFFGTTVSGGTNNGGTIFSILALTTNNVTSVTMTPLWSFGGINDGSSNCVSRLLLGADSNLYGTTENGGARNFGAIFSCSTNGAFALLYSFRGGTANGASPQSGLVQGTNGNYYGVTSEGGTYSLGTVYELYGFAPYIITQPTNNVFVTNSSITLNVGAGGTAPLTYQWQQNSNSIGNGKNFSGTKTNALTIFSGKNVSTNYYDVVVKNTYGSVTSSVAQLIVQDTFGTNPPILKITSPSLSKSQVIPTTTLHTSVSGTAVPDSLLGLSDVWYQLNGGGWQLATVSGTDWRVALVLSAGTNVFEVYAEDTYSQCSVTNVIDFLPNPFVPVAGSYNGLFFNADGVLTPTNAGSFNLSVTTSGAYTGKIQAGGSSYSMSGKLDADGMATFVAKGKTSLSGWIQVDMTYTTDRAWGVISNDSWQATLDGDLAVYDGKTTLCPLLGKYTFALAGTNLALVSTNLTLPGTNFSLAGVNSSALPPDGSYGTITVSAAGLVNFSAYLSDGTTFSQSVPLSRNGLWPLYAPLYSSQGMIWSWQSFPTNGLDTFKGDVAWIKPPATKAGYYTNGFALRSTPLGSAYSAPPSGQNVFDSSDETFIATGGGILDGITNLISLSPTYKLTDLATTNALNKLSLSFTAASGIFKGSFTQEKGGKPVSFSAVMVGPASATGYFLGTNQTSGQVWITSP